MRTQVFAHRGIVGIKSNPDAEGLLNRPMDPGQLGFVVDGAHVDIHPDAIEALKTVKKSADCIGDVDVFRGNDGKVVFSWLGGPMRIIDPATCDGSRDYDPSLLVPNPGVQVDPDFVACVESKFAGAPTQAGPGAKEE